MIQMPLSPNCDCCGLPIGSQSGEDCPRCNYPVNLSKEEWFLESNLLNLQRVVDYGGANLTVSGLIRRYGLRLTYLRKLKSRVVTASSAAPQPAVSPVGKQAETVPPLESRFWREPVSPPKVLAMSAMPAVSAAPEEPQLPVRHTFSFSWRSFVVDQAITIIGLLGAFLILIGALSSVVTTGGNAFLSFLIVFGVHALFGVAGVVAYRFVNFRLIARIYTGIYTLLVPLVGFTGYTLVQGTQLSVPALVAIAAGYAAIVYVLLAVYERFPIFAYLGGIALIVAELAVTADLHLDFWWWPSMLLLLAFPALISIARTSTTGRERFFKGSLLVLRQPVRVLMFTIAGASLLGLVGTTLLSFVFDGFGAFAGVSGGAIRFSILSMTVLLLIWTSILLWLTKRTQELIVLAFLLLASVLAFSYAFNFSQGGYALALAGVALLYHGLSRFAPRLLMPFEKLGLNLDQIALFLIGVIPFISSLQLPQQLIFAAYQIPVDIHLYGQANWVTFAGLIAVGVGLLITISVALYRAKLHIPSGEPTKQHNDWPWLLLLSGFLLTWEYSVIVLVLHITPLWYFVGLTFVLAGIAVLVRERFGAFWANPLDIIALSEIVLTLALSLGQGTDRIAALLLGFSIITYGVLLYQRRQGWLFFPLSFAVLALPLLIFTRPYVVLLIGLLLPLVAVAMRRLMANRLQVVDLDIPSKPERAVVWEWPLLAVGLLYGVVVSLFDVLYSGSTVSYWFYIAFHVPIAFPVALEMATLVLTWYLSAALAQVKWWLFPVIAFAIAALLLPSNPFWILVTIAPVAALLAFAISRASERVWASPLYIVALFAAVMAGIAGYQNAGQLFAASWILLGFGLFAYIMGLAEDLEPCLWLLPAFAIWSLIDFAQLNQFYPLPIVVLLSTTLGLVTRLLNLSGAAFPGSGQKNRRLNYALPLYLTALAAAALTGLYFGSEVNYPFYGAVAAAMLLYAVVACIVMLFERVPEMLLLPAGFAALAVRLWQPHLDIASLMIVYGIAYSVLCVLIFASQFVWKVLLPSTRRVPASLLHNILGIGGQLLVVLVILGNNVLFPGMGLLPFEGAGALFVLAAMVFCYGRMQGNNVIQRACDYTAGLLVSLVVSWVLAAFRQTNLDLLLLAPATYLIVIAPLLLRDETLPQHQRIGQVIAVVGAALLLLPTLWLSFSNGDGNLLYTIVLMGEAMVLLLLGIGLGVRSFVLSGTGLIVVGAIHALFLTTNGLPWTLTLIITGVTLLAIATALSIAGRRLRAAWANWD